MGQTGQTGQTGRKEAAPCFHDSLHGVQGAYVARPIKLVKTQRVVPQKNGREALAFRPLHSDLLTVCQRMPPLLGLVPIPPPMLPLLPVDGRVVVLDPELELERLSRSMQSSRA